MKLRRVSIITVWLAVFLIFASVSASALAAESIYLVEPSAAAPYVAGTIKPEVLDDALAFVNYIRRLAGVPDDVTLNEEYTLKAQHATVVLAKNNDPKFPFF